MTKGQQLLQDYPYLTQKLKDIGMKTESSFDASIVDVLEILNNTCHRCLNADSGCYCVPRDI